MTELRFEMGNILNAFDTLSPYLADLFADEVAFSITDRNKFLRSIPSKNKTIEPDVEVGDPIAPESGDAYVIKENRPFTRVVPKEAFGIAMRVNCTPLRDSAGMVIGSLASGTSLERQMEVQEVSRSLATAMEQITQAICLISKGVQELTYINRETLEYTQLARNEAHDTDKVVDFVKSIANETNLLGLNASIEAVHVGELGKGFGVVATEIRKLSAHSKESIKQIEDILIQIYNGIGHIYDRINKAHVIFIEQSSALQEITASIEELNATIQVLNKLAEKL